MISKDFKVLERVKLCLFLKEPHLSPSGENKKKLLKGMLDYEDLTSEGWKYTKDVMRAGKYTSQVNNIANELKDFIDAGLVEKRIFREKDSRNRMPKRGKNQYRLKPEPETYVFLKAVFFKERAKLRESTFVKQLMADNRDFLFDMEDLYADGNEALLLQLEKADLQKRIEDIDAHLSPIMNKLKGGEKEAYKKPKKSQNHT